MVARAFFTLMAAASVLAASDLPAGAQEISWSELTPRVLGRDIQVRLHGGTTVSGEAVSVRAGSMSINVKKSSDQRRYPAGQTSIPRETVDEICVAEYRGSGGRIVGAVLGALLGMVAGAEVAVHGTRSEAAGVSAFSAVATGVTAGGYYLGKARDRRVRVFRVSQGEP